MRRNRLSLLVAAGVLTALACNEGSVAPRAATPRAAPSGGAAHSRTPVTAVVDAPENYVFDITTTGGTITLGDRFTLTFPANAVCDPSSSSYGLGHWNDSCTPTDKSITVHAKIWQRNGYVYVDFSPALRFSPTAEVILSTDLAASVLAGRTDLSGQTAPLRRFSILYATDASDAGSNEYYQSNDKSLVTKINLITGTVSRRIKHFSGYIIADSGEPCDPQWGDPNCIPDPSVGGYP